MAEREIERRTMWAVIGPDGQYYTMEPPPYAMSYHVSEAAMVSDPACLRRELPMVPGGRVVEVAIVVSEVAE